MNIAVRYFSRGGNTKKIADAIGKAAQVEIKDCSIPVTEPVDLLFLGGSVYGFGIDPAVKDFISQLNPALIKNTALFGTSAIVKTGNQDIAKLLQDKNIPVIEENFYCRGEFTLMHKGRPNKEDLKDAGNFAAAIINKLKGE